MKSCGCHSIFSAINTCADSSDKDEKQVNFSSHAVPHTLLYWQLQVNKWNFQLF